MLDVQHIAFAYQNGDFVFEDISFQLAPGEILSIVGPSGAGKTTLIKCLAGLKQLTKGKIYIEDEELIGPEDQLIPGHAEIALVRQLFELEPYFTAEENLANQLHHLSNATRQKFVAELLTVFGLESKAQQPSGSLSGGEQQRLTMACALAKEPKLLLLDEPFVHMDVHLTKSIGEYLRKMAEIRAMSVILVTHNGAEALSWATRIFMLRAGKITTKYSPQKAYFKPKNLYEGSFFGELNSMYLDGKQLLFRPTEYSLLPVKEMTKVEVKWIYSLFKGMYFANYFKLVNGKEIVLYAQNELNNVHHIYV